MAENHPPAASSGLHHITAIAGDAQRNLDFYTGVLGQRLVKKTVNFDDPGTYHFYFADEVGSAGTVLTFFPFAGARRGVRGSCEATAVAYNVAADALPDWQARLARLGIDAVASERFGAPLLTFADPDDMAVELVGSAQPPQVRHWQGGPVGEEMALRGFYGTTLQVRNAAPSAALLRDSFGWHEVAREGNRRRFAAGAAAPQGNAAPGQFVDIVELPSLPAGRQGAGSIHHIAFRAADDGAQAAWQRHLAAAGLGVTDVRDRQYFRSIYFREPNGVLFEIATDGPGFLWDEPIEALGSALRLPPWLEPQRTRIEASLPALQVVGV